MPYGSARVVRLAPSPPARGDVDVWRDGAVPDGHPAPHHRQDGMGGTSIAWGGPWPPSRHPPLSPISLDPSVFGGGGGCVTPLRVVLEDALISFPVISPITDVGVP